MNDLPVLVPAQEPLLFSLPCPAEEGQSGSGGQRAPSQDQPSTAIQETPGAHGG